MIKKVERKTRRGRWETWVKVLYCMTKYKKVTHAIFYANICHKTYKKYKIQFLRDGYMTEDLELTEKGRNALKNWKVFIQSTEGKF